VDHGGVPLHAVDVEGHRPLHAVQVVVQAGSHRHKQGGGHPVQPQGSGQLVSEEPVAQVDGALGLINGQQGPVPLGQSDLFHGENSFSPWIFPLYSPQAGIAIKSVV
jgi:hypothetical protein